RGAGPVGRKRRCGVRRNVGCVQACPLSNRRVPPHELLLLAPRLAVGPGRRAVVENAPIGRPGKAPALAAWTPGIARTGSIDAVRRIYAGIDPTAARRGTVGRQLGVACHE